MRRIKNNRIFVVATLLCIGFGTACAGGNSTTGESDVRTLKSPRFARALVEKWIEEYAKVEPAIHFELAKASQTDADLSIVIATQEDQQRGIGKTVYFGESAVLPITSRGSEADEALHEKRLNTKKLKQLFFLNNDLEEEVKKNKTFEHLIIYSGSSTNSVASAFARNFGEETANFRGKRIAGDDLFLNTAIDKDPKGVSFNTLPNIFDLQSRTLKQELSLVCLDLHRDVEATFSNTTTLDAVIGVLEKGKPHQIAIERVGLCFNGVDDVVAKFIEWVMTVGTKYNHDYGLLNLDKLEASAEINKIKSALTAQK